MHPWNKDKLDAIESAIMKYDSLYIGMIKPIFMYKEGENCRFEIVPENTVHNFETIGYKVCFEELCNTSKNDWVNVLDKYIGDSRIPVFTMWVDSKHHFNKTKLIQNKA